MISIINIWKADKDIFNISETQGWPNLFIKDTKTERGEGVLLAFIGSEEEQLFVIIMGTLLRRKMVRPVSSSIRLRNAII